MFLCLSDNQKLCLRRSVTSLGAENDIRALGHSRGNLHSWCTFESVSKDNPGIVHDSKRFWKTSTNVNGDDDEGFQSHGRAI